MKAYKLFKVRKDGSLGSLFINASEVYAIGEWIEAIPVERKGYAFRPGWHCLLDPVAPHLKTDLKSGQKRAWYEVEVEDLEFFKRPVNQGGEWVLAQRLKIIKPL